MSRSPPCMSLSDKKKLPETINRQLTTIPSDPIYCTLSLTRTKCISLRGYGENGMARSKLSQPQLQRKFVVYKVKATMSGSARFLLIFRPRYSLFSPRIVHTHGKP